MNDIEFTDVRSDMSIHNATSSFDTIDYRTTFSTFINKIKKQFEKTTKYDKKFRIVKCHMDENCTYARNGIRTSKYTLLTFLPKTLWEQYHRLANFYFTFLAAINFIPILNAFAPEINVLPLLFVLSVTAIKDAFEDWRRHISDRKINRRKCQVFDWISDKYVKKKWEEIQVGDLVQMHVNEIVPADILLLTSTDPTAVCYVETSSLDGESSLKQKQAILSDERAMNFVDRVHCEQPNTNLHKFTGYIELVQSSVRRPLTIRNILLRGSKLCNTTEIEGLVIYAGQDTKSMLNNSGPRYKHSLLETLINRDIIWCAILLAIMCITGAIGTVLFISNYELPTYEKIPFFTYSYTDENTDTTITIAHEGCFNFLTFIIVFQVMIPLPLYVTIEFVKLCQVYFIHEDEEMYYSKTDSRIKCRAFNLAEDLGQIEYILSDKTGTLTENVMLFRKCALGGIDYSADETQLCSMNKCKSAKDVKVSSVLQNLLTSESESEQKQMVIDALIIMAICNTVLINQNYTEQETEQSNNSNQSPSDNLQIKMKQSISIANLKNWMKPKTTNEDVNTRQISRFDAENPDELALVYAAYAYGVILSQRSTDQITVNMPNQISKRFQLLHVLPFDSVRKRMSIIVKEYDDNDVRPLLLSKGADQSILDTIDQHWATIIKNRTMIENTKNLLFEYSTMGLRTLCLAQRRIELDEYKTWSERHQRAEMAIENQDRLLFESATNIEHSLLLLGATGVEDRLQNGIPETLNDLRHAGIKIWTLTGDKMETAVNIAYSSNLFSTDMALVNFHAHTKDACADLLRLFVDAKQVECDGRAINGDRRHPSHTSLPPIDKSSSIALLIDGKTLTYCLLSDHRVEFANVLAKCASVLFCRCTPLQKASIVKLAKERLNGRTLAIGDGANDVSMIQCAHVGIGISGQEGMNAVMASDFAIARFRYLKRLLFVEGHWCYDRLTKMILYFFKKNSILVYLLFIYQFYCGFSAQTILDIWQLQVYTFAFTSVPPLALGVFEQNANDNFLLYNSTLYSYGRDGRGYRWFSYWIEQIDSVYQAIVIFYVTYLAYNMYDIDIWSFGYLNMSSLMIVNQLACALYVQSFNAPILLSLSSSLIMYFVWTYIYHLFVTPSWSVPDTPVKVAQVNMTNWSYWQIQILTIILCFIPRLSYIAAINTIRPNAVIEARQSAK